METIARTNVKKEKGYLYFVDKQGDVGRSKMARGRGNDRAPPGKPEKVATAGVKKEKGYLYFVDKQGNISRSPAKNGGKA